MVVLKNGTVVDAEGSTDADVRIEDGVIVEVGDVDDGDDDVLDVGGGYVAPGLIDCHVHLMYDSSTDVGSPDTRSRPEMAYCVAASLRAYLSAGVTTVRDLGASGTLSVDAAAAVERGTLAGPDVIACGQNVTSTGGHGHAHGREADGRDEVVRATREQLKRGAEVIKCMATGGVGTPGSDVSTIALTEDELSAAVSTATDKGVPTAAHAHSQAGIRNAVRAGISSIEHGTDMDRESLDMMAETGAYWVPTLYCAVLVSENLREGDGSPDWEPVTGTRDAFEYAREAGVPFAMGTDAPLPGPPREAVLEELAVMAEYGLSPREVLRAATTNAADLLRIDDVGRVAEGYVGNLVVLDADPLEDVSAWRTVETVVKRGTVHAVDGGTESGTRRLR